MDEDFTSCGEGNGNDDLSLPKATVTKLIQEMLPADIVCSKETRDLVNDCCVEFIHLVSSEANDFCEKENKKTISPEHTILALKALGFSDYIEEIQKFYEEYKIQQKEKEKKSSKLDFSGLSYEELCKAQEALFAQSRKNVFPEQS